MSQTELLMKEIEGLPSGAMAQIFDFINRLKYTARPDRNDEPEVSPAITFAEARRRIKALGVNLSADRMLRFTGSGLPKRKIDSIFLR